MINQRTRFIVLFAAAALAAACGGSRSLTEPVGFEVSGNWAGAANGVRVSFTLEPRNGGHVVGTGSLTILSTGQVLPFEVGGWVKNAEIGEVSVTAYVPGGKSQAGGFIRENYGTFFGRIVQVGVRRDLCGSMTGAGELMTGPFVGVPAGTTPLNLSRP